MHAQAKSSTPKCSAVLIFPKCVWHKQITFHFEAKEESIKWSHATKAEYFMQDKDQLELLNDDIDIYLVGKEEPDSYRGKHALDPNKKRARTVPSEDLYDVDTDTLNMAIDTKLKGMPVPPFTESFFDAASQVLYRGISCGHDFCVSLGVL